jgi:uncharacterized OB-fold protein
MPLPKLNGYAREFYAWCKEHELRFQRCRACGAWRHAPRDLCAHCGSAEHEWAQSSGNGRLFSWTTVWQPMMAEFGHQVPYSPAIIELDEGVRLVSWIVDTRPEQLALGMKVCVEFDDVTPEVTLPRFRRAE